VCANVNFSNNGPKNSHSRKVVNQSRKVIRHDTPDPRAPLLSLMAGDAWCLLQL